MSPLMINCPLYGRTCERGCFLEKEIKHQSTDGGVSKDKPGDSGPIWNGKTWNDYASRVAASSDECVNKDLKSVINEVSSSKRSNSELV